MISEDQYTRYLETLLQGDGRQCKAIVTELLAKGEPPALLYTDLFQKALYRIGELWEQNRVSVAVEHLATAITERLLAIVYPTLLSSTKRHGRKAVIACSANEYHQIGARMVADIMESRGWDIFFVGANAPTDDLLSLIDYTMPEYLGISVSMDFNLVNLRGLIDRVRTSYPQLDILVGGQAFRRGGADNVRAYSRIEYIESLEVLSEFITQR